MNVRDVELLSGGSTMAVMPPHLQHLRDVFSPSPYISASFDYLDEDPSHHIDMKVDMERDSRRDEIERLPQPQDMNMEVEQQFIAGAKGYFQVPSLTESSSFKSALSIHRDLMSQRKKVPHANWNRISGDRYNLTWWSEDLNNRKFYETQFKFYDLQSIEEHYVQLPEYQGPTAVRRMIARRDYNCFWTAVVFYHYIGSTGIEPWDQQFAEILGKYNGPAQNLTSRHSEFLSANPQPLRYAAVVQESAKLPYKDPWMPLPPQQAIQANQSMKSIQKQPSPMLSVNAQAVLKQNPIAAPPTRKDGMNGIPPLPFHLGDNNSKRRTVPCRHWQKGHCYYGDHCRFAHENDP
eukprot:GILK01007332.1.p1 GENE.GILK01007332.1~~GILK01007332.1.p1  ORF type:complete len:349 (-),score=39.59 GILK01007332.1:259-1305(-)